MENEASLREPPSLDTSTKLINNLAVDGFVTTGEPIYIRLEAGEGACDHMLSLFLGLQMDSHLSLLLLLSLLIIQFVMFAFLQEKHISASGDIPAGSIFFLKGAMRVQTAVAVVVCLRSMGLEVLV